MADYRRKKRNLNKVDFTNKTKNQSKRYLINQFESLGIKVPNYVNNPTSGNINKALKMFGINIPNVTANDDLIDEISQGFERCNSVFGTSFTIELAHSSIYNEEEGYKEEGEIDE